MADAGYIYALENQCMPGIFKVGRTSADPFERAAQLSKSTGVPVPFIVVAYSRCTNSVAAEKLAHELIQKYSGNRRVNPRREFFECPYCDLVTAMTAAARASSHGFVESQMHSNKERLNASFRECLCP
jgi:hypothetical protein